MDRFSAIAPACVRVLLLPVGKIERHEYFDVVRQLQTHAAVVPLKTLETQVAKEDLLLSPHSFPGGSLLFNYAVAEIPDSQRQLAPFELHRETLIVLGIATGFSDNAAQHEIQVKKTAEELRERHGRVVHRHLLLIGKAASSAQVQHVTVIQSTNQTAVSQAMQEVAVHFLHELSTYAKAMQASPSVQTPGQVSQGMLRSMILREEEARPSSRHSALGDPKSPVSEEPGSRPPSLSQDMTPPATSFDQMPAANSLGRSDSNTSRRSKSRPRTTSFDRVPVLSKEKTKDRGKARVGIVIGSIYLMSGHWAEALKILIEHTTRSRALNDHIWNGKGLELIVVCLLLHLWAGIDVQVPAICYQLSDKVRDRFSKAFAAELAQKISGPQTAAEKLSSSLPDLLKHILLLYHSIEGTMELPYITVADATVRASRTLACLQATNGMLNEQSIPHIIEHKMPGPRAKWSSSTFLGHKPLSKTGISDLVMHALPTSEENVPLPEYISILTGVASVYSILRMDRKRAMTMKTLVGRLTTALHQARKLGAAEVGIHPATSLTLDNDAGALIHIDRSTSGLTPLAMDLVAAYGIDFEFGDCANTTHRNFGSATLKLEVLRDLLKLCEASPDLKGIPLMVVAIMSSAEQHGVLDHAARYHQMLLPVEEQSRLLATLSKAIGMSKQAGVDLIEYKYWDPFLVRVVERQTPPQAQVMCAVTGNLSSAPPVASNNPLLYDPNSRPITTRQEKEVLPLYEPATFLITLQNPYQVTIEIEHVELVTDGVALHGSRRDVRLGASRLEHISLNVLPEDVGDTVITGCRIKVAGCQEQVFPIARNAWHSDGTPLVKMIGQDALHESLSSDSPASEHDRLSITVIDKQPQLVFDGHSPLNVDNQPQHGYYLPQLEHKETSPLTAMLLEGEIQHCSIILENISEVPAFIRSTICQTESIELGEEQSKTDPVVIQATQSYVEGSPAYTHTMDFNLLGKRASTTARASIGYASSVESMFTRTIEVRFELTVKPVISVRQLDIVSGEHDDLIFILELHNLWTMPVTYNCMIGAEPVSCAEGTLVSGQSTMVHLRAARWLERSKMPDDTVAIKKELAKALIMRWHWAGRSGHIPLDNVELSRDALSVLAGPAIDIRLAFVPGDNAHGDHVHAGEFTIIRATLENKTDVLEPVVLQLQCQRPHAVIAADRQALVAGSMSRLIPAWSSDGSTTVDFAVCPLSIGTLAIDATVRPALSTGLTTVSTTMRSLVMQVRG